MSEFIADNNSIRKYSDINLVFEGIDTHADVFLNGKQILHANNMFRKWEIDVKNLLLEGENSIKVKFYPPVNINSNNALKKSYQLPDNRDYSRKAPYQFGWDWGSTFITCGIWQPVYFEYTNNTKLENCFIETQEINDEFAILTINCEVYSDVNRASYS